MISAQDLIEKITAAATCDDCIVVVKDKTQANLRWAGSTLTTNGVIQERSVTVVAFVAVAGGMASAPLVLMMKVLLPSAGTSLKMVF